MSDMQPRVLIVDDNKDSAQSLAVLLNFSGYTTMIATGGREGLAAAEIFAPEVTLVDLGSPRLSGYELARKIRLQPWGAEMVLVAVTDRTQLMDRRQSNEAGFDHFLVKPLAFAALKSILDELPRKTP